jgi:4-hydroxy-3-polyprenylbenzoate decarboxylase
MTVRPALSLREAVAAVRRDAPDSYHVCGAPITRDAVGSDFAARFAGIPANALARPEHIAVYTDLEGSDMPLVLGAYGDAERVRGWLPGLARRTNRESVERLLAAVRAPETTRSPPCQQRVEKTDIDIGKLAVQATPRDAGPYLTTGLVYARDEVTGEVALSVHRMLVLDKTRMTIWMVPGRQLGAMHKAAVERGGRMPVSINVGAPPAAMLASALGTRFLPKHVTKLDAAGALADAPIALAPAVSQPTSVLAESEIVLEGFLDDGVADESVDGKPDVSLPEFLGYDGDARSDLPVVTVTAMTMRREAMIQGCIGPGREQSVILGLAGELSVALSGDDADWRMIRDLHFSPAGGGMLLLFVQVRKASAEADRGLAQIAKRIFEQHPFVKLIIATDEDIDITSTEDVLWAVTTRCNLGIDSRTFLGFKPLPMDPSQGPDWTKARGRDGAAGPTFIDATIPYRLRHAVTRSFRSTMAG